ncbi:MAG: inositol phosphorylceramide synthase [Acidimicrobiia bacterium]|nr:inositol phosphorylceramide synthase [Acidimicrobiia bacterium]
MGWLTEHRAPVVGAFLVVSIGIFVGVGLPERQYIWIWLLTLLLLVCWHNPNHVAGIVLDWIPVLVILAGYDFIRGFATDLIPRATIEPQLRFDEILFGGTAPTVTLQRWLKPKTGPHPWDYLVFVWYLSHFFLTPAFALFLYRRDRERFHRYAMVILGVSLAGFATYFILPAAPPWWASRHGHLEPTIRVVHSVWAHLGASGPAKVFNGDAKLANPVAALPSLHAAWPMLLLLFAWNRAPRGRYVVLGYMAVMTFVLVYGAEHYVSDILLGWLYAVVIFLIVNRSVDRRPKSYAGLGSASPVSSPS